MSKIDSLQKYKGFPIPYIVYVDKKGTPHFKVNDERKVDDCIVNKKCSICGTALDTDMWLIGGPMSAFHPKGAYVDIPIHKECGIFALQNCPYMAYSKYNSKTPIGKLDVVLDDLQLYNPTQSAERLKYFVFIKISSYLVVKKNVYERFIYPEKPYLEIEFWNDGMQIDPEEAQRLDFGKE